jgi:hypothetical protein
MKLASLIAALTLPLLAQQGVAQDASGSSVPLSSAWNIASSGKASSSGELLFRVTPGNGSDPVEVAVFVLSGANESGVASSIRRALNTQLDAGRFNVQSGEGANVLLTDARGNGNFALELVDSDVQDVRVMVQSAAPVVTPTVPVQGVPAIQPPPTTPASPGDASPPPVATPPSGSAPPASSSSPPANSSAPPANSSAPPAEASAPPAGSSAPATPGGAGAAATAPPPG